jgi:hypothetical protein
MLFHFYEHYGYQKSRSLYTKQIAAQDTAPTDVIKLFHHKHLEFKQKILDRLHIIHKDLQ